MPGSGVNKNSLSKLIKKTKASEFHSSAKTFKKSKMNYFNKVISMGNINSINEYSRVVVDTTEVRKMIEILNKN